MNKIGSGCILQDVHLGKGDKGLSLFFPIQNDSMSVLLIWRVQCQKKAQPTNPFSRKYSIDLTESIQTCNHMCKLFNVILTISLFAYIVACK